CTCDQLVCVLFSSLHTRARVQRRPAFPAPSVLKEGQDDEQLGQIVSRERGCVSQTPSVRANGTARSTARWLTMGSGRRVASLACPERRGSAPARTGGMYAVSRGGIFHRLPRPARQAKKV